MRPLKPTRSAKPNCYLSLAARGCPTLRIPVDSADMASAMLAHYRDKHGIAASDMSAGCGNISTDAGELIPAVSYNSRVWNPKGELLQEAIDVERDARRTRFETSGRTQQGRRPTTN